MLHLPLLCTTALLCAALQQPGPHLRAIPEEVTGFVALNDLPDLLEKGQRNSWYRFFLDPRLAELRDWFDLQLAEIEHEAAASGLPSPVEIAAGIQAASAFVVPAEGTPLGAFGFVVQGRQEHAALRRLFEQSHREMAAESVVSTEIWREVELSVFTYTEPGEELDGPGTVVGFELDGTFGLVLGEDESTDREHVLSVARGCIDRITDGGPGVFANERFLQARGTRVQGDHVEGFVDVTALTAFIPEDREKEPMVKALVDSISTIPWVHGSARLGAGEELQLQLGFRCDPRTLLGELLSLSRPVPREMLELLPDDSVAISIGAFDLDALVALVLGGATKYGPEGTEAKIETGLALVRDQFGVDPIEDFLLLFSGEFATFQRLPEDRGVDLSASPGQVFSMMETFILGLDDGETLAENLEDLLAVTGFEVYLEVDDYEDVDVYSLPLELGVPLSWIITDDWLAVSGRTEDLHHLIRAGQARQKSVLDDERLVKAFEQARSACLFSVSDTAAVLKMMGEVFDLLGTTSEVSADAAEFGEAMRLFGSRGALAPGLVDKYFSGLMYASWTVEDGRVSLRTWGR